MERASRSASAWLTRSATIVRVGAYIRISASPDHKLLILRQGPWQGMHRREVERLKPEYRLALAREGYALVKSELAVFKPEV